MIQRIRIHLLNKMSQENACYIKHRVNIPDEQREKLLSAICDREAVSIRFRHEDLSGGNDLIAFTEQGSKIITSAFDKGREVIINMSKDQVQKHRAFMDEDDLIFLPV